MAVAALVGSGGACFMQHGFKTRQAGCEKALPRGNGPAPSRRPHLQQGPFTPTAHLVRPRSRAPIRAASKSFSSTSVTFPPARTSQKHYPLEKQPVESTVTPGNFRKPHKGPAALQTRHHIGSQGVVSSAISSLVSIRGGESNSWKAFYGIPFMESSDLRTGLRRGRGSALACTCSADLASGMFTFGTAMVVPFYTLMLAAPTWRFTRKVMDSALPYVVLGAMYMYLLFISWTPEHPKLMFSSKYWLPELPGITRMFSSMLTVSSAWIHLLAVDLFAGRNIYLDSITHDLPCRHSLVLCLMFGPVGIFSHLFTKIWLAPPWPSDREPADTSERRHAPGTS